MATLLRTKPIIFTCVRSVGSRSICGISGKGCGTTGPARSVRNRRSPSLGIASAIPEPVADVTVEVAALGEGRSQRGEGLWRDVLKFIEFVPGDEPHREYPTVRVVLNFAYQGRRHDSKPFGSRRVPICQASMPPACRQRSIAVDGYLSAREVHFQCMAAVPAGRFLPFPP